MKHLGLEPLIHAVLCPFRISIEIQIPIIDSRNMHAISIQLNHVHMIAAVSVAVLIFYNNEEWIRRYSVRSTHGAAKILIPTNNLKKSDALDAFIKTPGLNVRNDSDWNACKNTMIFREDGEIPILELS